MPQIGDLAPEFVLSGVHGDGSGPEAGMSSTWKLSDYRGQYLVLFFYPRDFTFVCPTEIRQFSERYADFREAGCDVLGVSTDSEFVHRAWIENGLGELNYPLLADPSHAVARAYGVLDEQEGLSRRATFVVDPDGAVQYALVHSDRIGRDAGEILRAVTALQTGELCPAGWRPGHETLGQAA